MILILFDTIWEKIKKKKRKSKYETDRSQKGHNFAGKIDDEAVIYRSFDLFPPKSRGHKSY